ncbi:MAG: DUF3787 domain-containing protein [Eubacteriales bacterium]|nr:DUF3787 domain-containing protein [Eubacteriales bacterium]
MKKNKKADSNYTPTYTTFPLMNTEKTTNDSNVSTPSENDIAEVKEWVDFKEM